MTDAVFVSGLSLHAYHGVMQHEAKVGQTFKLDLVLDIDLSAETAARMAPLSFSSEVTLAARSSRKTIPSTTEHLIRSRSVRDVRIVVNARRRWASRQFSAAPVE